MTDNISRKSGKGVKKAGVYDKTGKQKKINLYVKEFGLNKFLTLLPIIVITAIIPLIVKAKDYDTKLEQFDWFPNINKNSDFFLYYKQWIFITAALVMLFVILYKVYMDKKSIRLIPLLIPLAIYTTLALLSAIFSKYASFSFSGSMDQFESVFALLGYCILVFYAIQFINTEKDIQLIFRFLLVSVFLLIALGLSQFAAKDFFTTDFGKKLITSKDYWSHLSDLIFNFEKGQVYMTFFNPNYVGVYVALIAPILFVQFIFSKKVVSAVLNFLTFVGLLVCMAGSKSLTGLIALGFSAIAMLIFLWKPILKKYYIFIPLVIILMIGGFTVYRQGSVDMVQKLRNGLKMEKTTYNLTDIKTEQDKVAITYKDNLLSIAMHNEGDIYFDVFDSDNQRIILTYEEEKEAYSFLDDRFAGLALYPVKYGDVLAFCVEIEGNQWYFTDQMGDNTYYYINAYGKTDKIIKAPSAIFTGYESIASGRGYIWSRTIPLLKKYIILGSGPDTFTMAFPQDDYLFTRIFGNQVLTKPHCMYLQIAVQTGFLSLIAFLVFYLMYAVSCIRLYIHGRFESYYAKIGVAIFIGTIGYMICGIANDSSITTAPVFWALIGIGIAANYKAKPMILKERAALKAEKEKQRSEN